MKTLTRPTAKEWIKVHTSHGNNYNIWHAAEDGKTWPLCGRERDNIVGVFVGSRPAGKVCKVCNAKLRQREKVSAESVWPNCVKLIG